MTELIKRLRRLSGDNPVQWVKVTPDDWVELGAMVEDAELFQKLCDDAEKQDMSWIMVDALNMGAGVIEMHYARNTTNEG